MVTAGSGSSPVVDPSSSPRPIRCRLLLTVLPSVSPRYCLLLSWRTPALAALPPWAPASPFATGPASRSVWEVVAAAAAAAACLAACRVARLQKPRRGTGGGQWGGWP